MKIGALEWYMNECNFNIVANFVYNVFRVRFVSLVKFLAAFLLAPWRAAREINSSELTLSMATSV